MLFGKYRFICELQGDAILPYFSGIGAPKTVNGG